jgi:transcriptional antiterminator NusG
MGSYWYLVKVLPGKERQLKDKFNSDIELGNIRGIKEFVCPLEKELKMVKTKKVVRERVIYTGYLYFNTDELLTEDDLTNLSYLPDTMKVLGDKRPIRVRDREIQRVLKNGQEGQEIVSSIQYNIGETVKVIDGPFNTFDGEIRSINGDKVDVDVKVFGRPTKVTLSKEQIDKL